jgi:predicted porin
MKKHLLALAVLGAFAGAASAQSSVTIYGLLDQGIYKGNGGGATNPGANGLSEAWQIKQAAGSRLGFRGNEDLGGGLSAQFQFEHRFTPDTGAQNAAPAPFWAGRSYVQLTSAAAGAVYLGREYAPWFWPAVKSDPFGWDGVGQVSTHQTALYANDNGSSSVRTDNTIGYKSPNMGGLTVQAAVGLGEGSATGGRNMGFNVEYAAGPLYVAGAYDRISEGPNDGNNIINGAVHYDMGVAKLIGYFARAKVGGGELSNSVWEVAASVPLAGGRLKTAYAQLTLDNDDRLKKFGLGYDYPLSKRTNVYADLGVAAQKGVDRNNAFAVGVKHTF